MDKDEIIEKLNNLQVEIQNYANYIRESTYHPYSKIENFADELRNLIEEIKHDLI